MKTQHLLLPIALSLTLACEPLRPEDCASELLPLQNPRAHTLGETFYLPRPKGTAQCPSTLEWQVLSAPEGSRNTVYTAGAPEPRFTPEVTGDHAFRLGDTRTELRLRVVERSAAERFRNHYLTPLYGAARVGEELWTANGASYTVSRLAREGGAWVKRGEVVVGAWPSALAWREPLPYVLVAQRGSDTVGFIHRERGVLEDALWVGDEPSGLALSPDGKRLYVSLATEGQVAVVDVEQRKVVDRVSVGFDPRALALSEDGRRLFVASYRSGNRTKDTRGSYGPMDDRDIHIVDTEALRVEAVVEGVSADLRALALSEDGAELYVAATDGDPEPSQAAANARPFVHEVVVVGADPQRPGYAQVLRRVDLTRQSGSGGPVVNPSGVLAVGDRLWVASESSGVVVALDRSTLQERARVPVGPGARQLVRVDEAGTVAVHCQESFELWVVEAGATVRATVKVAEDPRPAAVALGERVFNRPGGNFAANHSCSSCHVETQNDGMVWRFGPAVWHNVRPLQLLDATTPLEWGAYVGSTANFGYQGPASIVSRPATAEEALGMQAFLSSLLGAPRANGHTRVDGSYSEAALRGKALFEGKVTCAGCHPAPLYTSRGMVERGKSGEPADIPSLLGVYRHGVYMVKGQARSLEGALEVARDYMRVTLSEQERADLLQFLRELTAKEAAPLGMWPDIDSNEAVYPEVRPWVAFSEPVDDSQGRPAAEVAAEYLRLEDAQGTWVPATVQVQGTRLELVPTEPLKPGERYRFRVLPGLPFLSGGALQAERRTTFRVAQAAGRLPGSMVMTVQVPSPRGLVPVALRLEPSGVARGDGLGVVLRPQGVATQQRQEVWVRVDGERFLMQPFALPAGPTAVADAQQVVGQVVQRDSTTGLPTRIEGTLLMGAPGMSVPGVSFTLTVP